MRAVLAIEGVVRQFNVTCSGGRVALDSTPVMATLVWKREGSAREAAFTLRGRPALLVLGLLVAAPLANALIARSSLPEGGAEAIRSGLSLEYKLNRIAGVEPARLSHEEGKALDRDLQRLDKVDLRSVKAKGWFWSYVVRTEVSVDGGPPPDGRSVRYLYMTCGPIVDCVVLDDVGWWRYGLGLWFVNPPAAIFPEIRRPGT